MGIKRIITKDELPLKYQEFNLIETKDGISHSVYLLDDKYVLKIVTDTSLQTVLNEKKLLEDLSDLCVPELLDIYEKENDILAFYTQVRGKSVCTPNISHIKQIALFLKEFHSISQNISSNNEKIYDKKYLKDLILQTNEPIFLNYFNTIECELVYDGVIHGDLFWDNAKFNDSKLSGVFDFIEACEGDFRFESAVVSISWCFDEDTLNSEKVNVLLENNDLHIKYDDFIEYIKYALLYYTTTRYLDKRNYKELLNKLDSL